MSFLEVYNGRVIKYDLVNTFLYQNLTQMPRLEKVIVNFGYPKSKLKNLISGLLALEFLSSKKGKITKSRHLNIFLKIKKGNPVGCKLVLTKSILNLFYLKLMTSIFPKIKRPQSHSFRDEFKHVKSISFQLKNPLLFAELENQFQFFKDTPKLDITLTTSARSQKELLFLLKSIKFFS
jgi:large subunit ribosomal protein L5